MFINDFLCRLLESLGLKRSEMERVRDDIARLAEELCCVNDALSNLDEELQAAERRFRNAKALYDDADGTMKKSRETLLLSVMKDCKHIQERQHLMSARRNALQALLHQRRLELEQLQHPVETDALEEAIDIKKEMLYNFSECDKALDELEGRKYQPLKNASTKDNVKTVETDVASPQEREYDELMDNDAIKNSEKSKKKDDKAQKTA